MKPTIILTLFLAFQFKHFVADYPLQTKYMLGKFKEAGWQKPLLAHVAVHAVFTFLITCWFNVFNAILFAVFDATTHFVMDRFKADKKYLGRFKPLTAETAPTATPEQWKSNTLFWNSLGLDQLIHHLSDGFVMFWIIFHAT